MNTPWNKEQLSIKGSNEWNEDALVINDSLALYGVVDGSTSLVPYRGPGGETGGKLASMLISQHLEALGETVGTSFRLDEAVLEANRRLREAMVHSGIDVSDKRQLWTAALAAVRIHERSIEYVQAGDCMLIAVYKDGTIRVVTHDQVAHIDKETKKLWQEGQQQGITTREELRQFVIPTIQRNRLKLNTLEGYSVVSGEPELEDLLEYGRINRIQLKALLLITDGLFLPKEKGETASEFRELTERIMRKGLAAYADWLISLEEADADGRKYPRFKKSDDKTGIWITLED
ncbi:protein phosphatase 2C domain-containing protein [Paenibacillus sp. J2TS4]|uniref:protein phosphatase 2C domain-containing protein n=1 Tax=Paenibacillus sp. J2TS4 TaxID=2807194 RepID=UPI001B1663DD|nr:protein phosphatase 2C domain-containing protein [Paenibacillus sp. J2TS4]GIP34687.1 serine/threonine protein phosphatase [Paenibacillus sp. J2TS4]